MNGIPRFRPRAISNTPTGSVKAGKSFTSLARKFARETRGETEKPIVAGNAPKQNPAMNNRPLTTSAGGDYPLRNSTLATLVHRLLLSDRKFNRTAVPKGSRRELCSWQWRSESTKAKCRINHAESTLVGSKQVQNSNYLHRTGTFLNILGVFCCVKAF